MCISCRIPAIVGLARCYLANDDPDRASQILDMAGPDRQMDPAIKSVRTAIDLMADAPKDSELDALIDKVTEDRANHALRLELAEALMARGRNKEAADHLLKILSDDLDEIWYGATAIRKRNEEVVIRVEHDSDAALARIRV